MSKHISARQTRLVVSRGCALTRLFEVLQRGIQPFSRLFAVDARSRHLLVERSPRRENIGPVGTILQRLGKICRRFGRVAGLLFRLTAHEIGVGQFAVEPERRIAIVDRPFELAQAEIGQSPALRACAESELLSTAPSKAARASSSLPSASSLSPADINSAADLPGGGSAVELPLQPFRVSASAANKSTPASLPGRRIRLQARIIDAQLYVMLGNA